jgi:hypothetical protein
MIYVVEVLFNDGKWDPAIGDNGSVLSSKNFYKAHELKRSHTAYLQAINKKIWKKGRLRIRKWAPLVS